jgi:S-formylglutathione hydrolase FrmB
MKQQTLHSTHSAKIKIVLPKIDLKKIGRSLIQFLSSSKELQVWQELDEQGDPSWSAYDPATNRSIHHVSEHQVRIWIEQCLRS